MGKGPDEIRAEIEATREALSADVDNLTEKVSPARVVERKVEGAGNQGCRNCHCWYGNSYCFYHDYND